MIQKRKYKKHVTTTEEWISSCVYQKPDGQYSHACKIISGTEKEVISILDGFVSEGLMKLVKEEDDPDRKIRKVPLYHFGLTKVGFEKGIIWYEKKNGITRPEVLNVGGVKSIPLSTPESVLKAHASKGFGVQLNLL